MTMRSASSNLPPAPARKASPYLVSRLLIGLAQGVGLIFLFAAPGTLTSPLGLVLLFAPLLLLAGLGSVPGKLLLPWTLIASVGLALLGAVQVPGATNLLLIAAAGLFLFIGQALIAAWGRSGAPLAGYRAYYDTGWSLGLQCLLCLAAAWGCAFLVNNGFAVLRLTYPVARPIFVIALLAPMAVAVTSWLASARRLQVWQRLTLQVLTLMLPCWVLLAAATGVAGLVLHWQPPLLFCLAQAFALLLCINASYGDGATRPHWREIWEAAASFALMPLIFLGAAALAAGAAHGWTGTRILAVAALAMLGGYAIFYCLSALIGLGGGGWMKRIERANLGLALVSLALLAALACH